MDLLQLSQDVKITINELSIGIRHERYDRDLYTLYSEGYDAKCELYDALQRKFEVVQELVTIKIATTGFTESELNVFNACIKVIESGIKLVETDLRTYDAILKIYKDMRWQY